MRLRLSLCCLAAVLFAACPSPTPSPKDDAGTPDAGNHPADSGTPPDAGHTVTPITVNGHVTYFQYGEPAASLTVSSGTQSTTTDASGAFTLSNITPPYELVLTYADGAYHYQSHVEGLTRTDPTFELPGYATSTPKTATVSGTLSGVTFPLPMNHYVQVVSVGAGGGTIAGTVNSTTGAYSIHVGWQDGNPSFRSIYAVEYTLDTAQPNFPTAFGGYGKISPSLSDGATVSGQNIVMSAPSTGTLNASVNLPQTPDTLTAIFGIELEAGCSITFSSPVTGAVFATLPHLNGVPGLSATYQADFGSVGLGTTNFAAKGGLAPGDVASLDAGAPLVLSPASGTAYTTGMTFNWTGGAGVFHYLFFDHVTNNAVTIDTTERSVKLPAGFTPSSGTLVWNVTAYPDAANTDAYAVPRGRTKTQSEDVSKNATVTVP